MTRLSEHSQPESAVSGTRKRPALSGEAFVTSIQRDALNAQARAVEARSALRLGFDIEVIIEHVERQGFISRSGGNLSTDNPFVNEAERASEAARQISAVLCSVWARGWDKADQELAGD